MAELALLKPEKKVIYVYRNGKNEKIEQLHVPSLTLEQVKKDVRAAGKYKAVYELAKRKQKPHYVLLYGGTKEERLMAVSYLAGLLLHERKQEEQDKDEDLVDEERNDYSESSYASWSQEGCQDEDQNSDEVWEENPYQIPLISYGEMSLCLTGKQEDRMFGGSFLLGGETSTKNLHPYWMDCKAESVCIEVQMGSCDWEENISRVVEQLQYFDTNRQVYVTIDSRPQYFWDLGLNEESKEEADEEEMRQINLLKLSLLADEAALYGLRTEEYDKMVLNGFLKHYGLRAAKRFPYETILGMMQKANKNYDNSYMDMIVHYCKAEREKKDVTGRTVREKDFSFLKLYEDVKQNEERGKSARECLQNDFVGLHEVRKQIFRLADTLKFNQMRMSMGLKGEFHNTHLMIGPPGTAKSSIAKRMAQLMQEEDLIPGGRFVAVNGAELKGAYVGQTAPKVKALFDEYDCIFIDEAYSLMADGLHSDSYSNEAMAQLLLELEKHSTDKLVVFAGYGGKNVLAKDNKMQQFLDTNPGIKSRINSTFVFEPYTAEEMWQIFLKQAQLLGYETEKAEDEAKKAVISYFSERSKAEDFGNGREARVLLELSTSFMAERVMAQKDAPREAYLQMEAEDIKKALQQMQEAQENQEGVKVNKIGFFAAEEWA